MAPVTCVAASSSASLSPLHPPAAAAAPGPTQRHSLLVQSSGAEIRPSIHPGLKWIVLFISCCLCLRFSFISPEMHPPLTLHRHPMCAEIIEDFQKCHLDHPVKKFFGECTDLKIKLDRCFRQEKALKRKANFEESKKFKEQLQAYKREIAEKNQE
ncbi:hypothetical protein ACP4OV_006412 [Aristida adscensionis]